MFFSYNESVSARNHPANRMNLRIETRGKALYSRCAAFLLLQDGYSRKEVETEIISS
jgi:hypothetical protein